MILWPSGPWVGETCWRFGGAYCLHLHGDWVGFSWFWSYTENKFCWLSRMIWCCLAGHSYEGWEEGCECSEPWDLRFPAQKRTVLKNLTPTGSRRSCLLVPPPVSVTGQTRSNRPLLCAIDRKFSLSHSHPSQPIQLPWRGDSTFLRNVAKFNHYVVLKPKRLSSQKITDTEIETQLFSVWITGFAPALIEGLNPTLQTSQSEPGLPRMLDTTLWRQVSSLFPKAPLAGSISRYVWQLNIVSLLVFHLHAHNGPGM
jgi:hypothetical protein